VAISINWAFNVAVDGGPQISLANAPKIVVDAYDLVTATLPAGSTGTALNLQPSATAGDVVLLALSSDAYDATVTFDPDGGGNPQQLSGPVLLVGAGPVGLLGATPPKSMTFDNPLATPVTVKVLIGRTA
jgi:hypothetical protein